MRDGHLPPVSQIKANLGTLADVSRKDQFLSLTILLKLLCYTSKADSGHHKRRAHLKKKPDTEEAEQRDSREKPTLGDLLEPMDPAQPESRTYPGSWQGHKSGGYRYTTYRWHRGTPVANCLPAGVRNRRKPATNNEQHGVRIKPLPMSKIQGRARGQNLKINLLP